MKQSKPKRYLGELLPFGAIASRRPEPRPKPIKEPIWTKNKAVLIQRYLLYFEYITKHGTYIDGFAGPQQPESPEMWAAKLVLDNRPRWFRNFYLFDEDAAQIARLRGLKLSQPPREKKEPKRNICIKHGDCNSLIADLLNSEKIREKEATFCLLDQRTFECHWSTLVRLSKYKQQGNKIELFYFFPHGWLGRALAAQMDKEVIAKWWGKKDWPLLKDMRPPERLLAIIERFKKELGYWSVIPWPIYESERAGRIMYYMIHASDHPEGPRLMSRAYSKALGPMESPSEIQIELALS